jgi:hypothetical protein
LCKSRLPQSSQYIDRSVCGRNSHAGQIGSSFLIVDVKRGMGVSPCRGGRSKLIDCCIDCGAIFVLPNLSTFPAHCRDCYACLPVGSHSRFSAAGNENNAQARWDANTTNRTPEGRPLPWSIIIAVRSSRKPCAASEASASTANSVARQPAGSR